MPKPACNRLWLPAINRPRRGPGKIPMHQMTMGMTMTMRTMGQALPPCFSARAFR